ncbi:MAG TPA: OsmC family protein [Geothermobacteraceae bacterium]|nr:OsmC family protein [Geothermobacteraceae bacterium]
MEMQISFPGGVSVQADYKGFSVISDQPEANGGSNQSPSPFDLFLISLGNCAGFFALRFCQQRDLDTSGLGLSLTANRNQKSKRLDKIAITIQLPTGFPEKYRQAIIKATDQCAVKKVILDPPEFEVVARP